MHRAITTAAFIATAALLESASGETCSGFEDRLDALIAKAQQMISEVEAMQPSGLPACGGLIGTNVDSATFLAVLSTKDGSGNEAYRTDPEWCCNQCRAYSGCTIWTLQFVGNFRCQLYGPKDNGSNVPTGYLFGQPYGIGEGVTRVSGYLPPDGLWGSVGASDRGGGSYMENVGGDTSATRVWIPVSPAPTGAVAEGYEMCDSLGPFKPDWVSSSSADNGNPMTLWVQHPLECCSLCARSKDIHNNDLDNPCAIWAYSYAVNQRQCILRDSGYINLTGNPQSNLDDLANYQNNGAVCAQYDTVGNPREHPDGSACGGTFEASRWSSGLPSASDIATLKSREEA